VLFIKKLNRLIFKFFFLFCVISFYNIINKIKLTPRTISANTKATANNNVWNQITQI